MADKKFLSWDEIQKDTLALGRKIQALDRPFSMIVGIARGGLGPASILSQFLGIRYVETLCLASYSDIHQQTALKEIKTFESDASDILVIDDLVDSGVTMQKVNKLLPNALKVCLYAKPKGCEATDLHVHAMPQDTWLVFPWELSE